MSHYINRERIARILDPVLSGATWLDADGATWVARAILKRYQIPHIVCVGSVGASDMQFAPHHWIEIDTVADGRLRVDYSMRPFVERLDRSYNGASVTLLMDCLTDGSIPHGVVAMSASSVVVYDGHQAKTVIELVVGDTVYNHLIEPEPPELFRFLGG